MILGKQYTNGITHWTPITPIKDGMVVLVTDRATYDTLNFAVVRHPEFDEGFNTVSWGHAIAYDCSLQWALNIYNKYMVCPECKRVHRTIDSYRSCNCEVD